MAARGAMAMQQPVEQGRAVLDLHLGEVRQIFNSMDPAPFRERDLDPKAVDYIVEWAEELPKHQPLAMTVHLGAPRAGPTRPAPRGGSGGAAEPDRPDGREPAAAGDGTLLGDAVREYFRRRAAVTRRELSHLFRVGRVSLLIGVMFLGAAITVGQALAGLLDKESYGWLLKESLIIGGWVALWRPMEIFLYDWWPIRARARLYDRLGDIDVSVRGAAAGWEAAA